MKTEFLLVMGIFLIIFSIDGILFLESAIPECMGFTGMGWFVFITMGFNTMAILSNPECSASFYMQTGSATLFGIGFSLIIYLIIQRPRDRIQYGVQLENEN